MFYYLGFEKGYVKVLQKQQVVVGEAGGETNVYDYDELQATFKVRYMTSMEAYLRLQCYPIVKLSHQMYALPVHDEGGQTIVIQEGQETEGLARVHQDTRLTGFFKICQCDPQARKYTYNEIPYLYRF